MATHKATIEDRRIDGMYGEVWHEGVYQGDILEITGRVAIERREIPRAGTDSIVYRRGRVSREGTFRIGKIDSRWESLILGYAGLTPEDRREMRCNGTDPFPETHFIVRLDDPDSWGEEEIQLLGVKMWEIPLGYTMNDLVERELPFTWELEKILAAVPRPGNKQGASPDCGQTWPPAGDEPVI